MYLSDKQRVELALPASFLRRAFAPVVEKDARHNETMGFIKQALIDPFEGLDDNKIDQLLRRTERIQSTLMLQHEKSSVFKCLLMVFIFVKILTDTGILNLVEGSNFDIAVTRLIDALGEHGDLWEDIRPTAEKHANRLLRQLQAMGYYQIEERQVA